MIIYLLDEVESGRGYQLIRDSFSDIQPVIAEIQSEQDNLFFIKSLTLKIQSEKNG